MPERGPPEVALGSLMSDIPVDPQRYIVLTVPDLKGTPRH